jgi:hypothetical protein
VRQEVLDYIDTLSLGTYTKSNNLPYTASGQILYVTNPKVIYVDQPNITEDPIITGLDGLHLNNKVQSVIIYFSSDAKSLPANYTTLVNDLKNAKNITTVSGVHRREIDVNQSYQGDLLITEIAVRLITIT